MKTLLKCIVAAAVIGAIVYGVLYKSPQRKAFEAALTQARQGQAAAQLQVAQAYLAGEVIAPDVSQAVAWYQKAAAQGDGAAAYELAQLYLTGEKLERDIDSGVSYLKLAAAKNYAPAQYALGRLYQTGTENLPEHLGQAAWWWIKASAQNDPDAQAALEQLQSEDPELVARAKQLIELEQKAQSAVNVETLVLAEAYQNGDALEKDDEQAEAWYKKLADSNVPQAQYALYQWYMGPSRLDELKALEYLQKAAEGADARAQYEVGDRIYQMAQNPEEYQIAFRWFDLAAQQNHTGGLYMRAIMQMQGQGTAKNIQAAMSSFKQAAELGHADAQYVLGQSYYRGIGVKANRNEARRWLQQARDNGNEQAATLLTQMH